MSLNLPAQELKIMNQEDGRPLVWDKIRCKYVAFTPEENVRQHFTRWLEQYKGIPASHMANEVTLNLNGLTRRCDTVIYDARLVPVAICEYKSPSVTITQETFKQIARYNLVLRVDYLIVSNGMKHYCLKMDYATNGYEFMTDIPGYDALKRESV